MKKLKNLSKLMLEPRKTVVDVKVRNLYLELKSVLRSRITIGFAVGVKIDKQIK